MVSIEELIKEREQLKNRIKKLQKYYFLKKTELTENMKTLAPLVDNSNIKIMEKELLILKEKIDKREEEIEGFSGGLTENENQNVILKELETLESQINIKEEELANFDNILLENVSKMTEIERQNKN